MKDIKITFKVNLRALVIEAFSVATLCYVAGWATLSDNIRQFNGAPFEESFTTASVLIVFIILAFDISGAQFNPAISISLAFLKKQEWKSCILYIVSQLLGSVIGAVTLHRVASKSTKKILQGSYPKPDLHYSKWQLFWYEFIGTFLLAFAVYLVIGRKGSKFQMAFMVATVVLFNILAFSQISGTCLNPARVFGPSLVENDIGFEGWYLYWVGPIAGAIAGGVIHHAIFLDSEVLKRYFWWFYALRRWWNKTREESEALRHQEQAEAEQKQLSAAV